MPTTYTRGALTGDGCFWKASPLPPAPKVRAGVDQLPAVQPIQAEGSSHTQDQTQKFLLKDTFAYLLPLHVTGQDIRTFFGRD